MVGKEMDIGVPFPCHRMEKQWMERWKWICLFVPLPELKK